MFLMGSSFMMLLEVPKDYKLNMRDYQYFKEGQRLNEPYKN